MRALLAVVALLVAAPAAAGATNPWIEKTPLDIAHQGGEDEFPSNTMYAFQRSLQVGADMLELDVGVTKDGQVVVMHDTTVDRTTNGHGTVASFTLKQLRKLDAAYWFSGGSNAYRHDRARSAYRLRGVATGKRKPPKGFTAADFRVPTLKEVLRAFPHTPINVEIKGRTKAEALAEYLDERRRPGADAEVHQAPRHHRRLLQAGGRRSLPPARARAARGARHRRGGQLAAGRQVTRRRRRRLPAADHLPARRPDAADHDQGQRRARPPRGLRLAHLAQRRRREPQRSGARCSTWASTA